MEVKKGRIEQKMFDPGLTHAKNEVSKKEERQAVRLVSLSTPCRIDLEPIFDGFKNILASKTY